MKKLMFTALMGCILCGCDPAEFKDEGIENSCTKFTYMNHSYLRFEEVYKYRNHDMINTGSRISIIHNPDCPCITRGYQIPDRMVAPNTKKIGTIESKAFQIPEKK